mgnify:CR=1 FL=1
MKKITDKGKEIFGLNKIPDKNLLRESRIEIGKLNSYIDELENKVSELSKNISIIDLHLSDSAKELKNMNTLVKKYKDEYNVGIANAVRERDNQINKLTKENNALSSEVNKLNKVISILQNQLVKMTSVKL